MSGLFCLLSIIIPIIISITTISRSHNNNNNTYYCIYIHVEYLWTRETKLKIRGKWPSMDIQFVDIAETWNSMLPNASFVSEDRDNPLSSIQYKQMCAFMMKGFTEIPMLKRYKYLMRLDDDVCIQSPINYDMFEEMKNSKAMYAFPQIFSDIVTTTRGMHWLCML